MWEYGFKTMAAGWSTGAGMLVFVVFGVIALVCLALMRRRAVYDGMMHETLAISPTA